ncbi:PHP domain-containing protein [Candidatus Poribacteria bacterium]|jgi:hypothetical protein|nr:PHP domain-containing protein [Candidatus Poribacteria bacterium]MBT5535702.1 PHP domain-containing protein [Candidatus Poribacteria bacterium]MBT5713786.1 PHP domain-containing protein [Candidatus Poribacteria bacterium]MBT7095843.1 PHP domain-containing protein [Candidatus Poribacteria bacterium]MBT7807180.1 PHP domain-containing protein [Candidatus Poribacteria bacterium]
MFRMQGDSLTQAPDISATLYDYAGAIHIHSTLSDGSGTVPEIVRDAQSADLDFIMLTDHEHLQARDLGYEGWHDDLLCLVGEEVTPRFHNHYLAFDIDAPVKGRGNWRQPQRFIDQVQAQDGIGFIAHPIGEDYPTRAMACPWLDWNVTGFTGIELWSYMHDWVRNVRWKNVAAAIAAPDKVIQGPHHRAVRMWDELGKKRPVVALGTLDIHAKKIPGIGLPQILPYAFTFKTVRTHVLLDAPLDPNDSKAAAAQVYAAIRAGHCYMAHDGFGDSTGFYFDAQHRGRIVALMGDELPFAAGMRLHASVPEQAYICLVRDGHVIEEFEGKRLSYAITQPGVYRIEVRRRFKPWIYSNPIYVRTP